MSNASTCQVRYLPSVDIFYCAIDGRGFLMTLFGIILQLYSCGPYDDTVVDYMMFESAM